MGKKHKCPEFENHERWLVSYADMLTLLFAVFVVLYSLNMSGDNSESQATGSIQESFNTPLEDIPIDRRIGPSQESYGIFRYYQNSKATHTTTKTPDAAVVTRLDKEYKKLKITLENRLYGPKRFRDNKKPGQARIIDITRTPKEITLRLYSQHFFASGSTKIRREAMKDFDEIVETIKELGRHVTIEGHTDSIPPKGRYSNWEISALRAASTVRYMIKRHNFPPSLLSIAGYADLRPIAHNSTESGRSLNRRIEIKISYDDENTDDPE